MQNTVSAELPNLTNQNKIVATLDTPVYCFVEFPGKMHVIGWGWGWRWGWVWVWA